MAKEAILKIKKAEDNSAAIIKKASDSSREILREAETSADAQKKSVIDDTKKEVAAMLEIAQAEAESHCQPLIAQGEKEIAAIKNPKKDKVDSAVKLVIERIVNVNGNT